MTLVERLADIRRAMRGYRVDEAIFLADILIADLGREPGRCPECGGALDFQGLCCHQYMHRGGVKLPMDLRASIKHLEAAIEARAKDLVEDLQQDVDVASSDMRHLAELSLELLNVHDRHQAKQPAASPDPKPVAPQPVPTGYESPSNTDPTMTTP